MGVFLGFEFVQNVTDEGKLSFHLLRRSEAALKLAEKENNVLVECNSTSQGTRQQ
jgi:hypothetical protein